MIPILFAASATAFTTNGIGRLTDTISCEVTEERNGIYEMTLVYPMTGIHYASIATSSIIVVKPSQSASLQAFRAYKISRPIGGRVTVYCRHISYQLNYIPFKPFSASSLAGALAGFKSNAVEPCPFTLTADFASASSYAVPIPGSIRSYLGGREGSIIDIYGNGAEWEWNNYNCILHAHRGADRGVVLRYGKQITDVTQETNIENTITGIMPYWLSEDTKVYLNAPVESATAANFPFHRTVVKDFSDKWENAPTQAQLQSYTQSYINANKIGIPAVSISVNFINLADTLEYKDLAPLETVNLCDTITVDFARLGISTKAKVIKTVYDVLKERYTSIDIGDSRASLSTTIEDQLQAISARPTYAQAQRTIDRATGVLNSGLRGHVIINRNPEGWANEILFLDNENIESAHNVVRINNAGIGFSSTGYRGPYYQSWTIDGHLSLGGINNHYGDFMVLDENGIPTVEMDKSGLRLWRTKAIGYLSNGRMYRDPALTQLITPETGAVYYDLTGGTFYIWSGSAYRAPQGHEGLNARMTTEGLGLYNGEIDLKWNGETGIYFKAGEAGGSDELMIGDFMVNTDYGRQIWESSDEMTGMSGEPEDYGGYFLWAGWRDDSDFAFAVEDQGGGGDDNVVINGHLIVNGTDILDYIRSIEVKDDDDEGPGGGGGDGESGGDGPGYEGIEVIFDNNVFDGGDGPGSSSGGSGSGPSGPASDPDLQGGG